ncbi:hypothetical protein MBOU_58420 [Mycobacterium bourgelatii]|uniref:Uncharacterized protein n=1 Tax=Mycobacterium bourgelatii TaxID=1273442 RepID=A0A7I9YYI1_MYCBU|nr:hypothetical protein MBOU_58420 [Mycobacterium bourgelatii]
MSADTVLVRNVDGGALADHDPDRHAHRGEQRQQHHQTLGHRFLSLVACAQSRNRVAGFLQQANINPIRLSAVESAVMISSTGASVYPLQWKNS